MISRETGITHAGYMDNIDIRSPDQFRKRGCFLMSGGTENTVGKRIRQKRKELGLSQEGLAERMNVTAALISNYENDKVDIKTSVMRELAGILGTSAAYLMDGAPEIDPDKDLHNSWKTECPESRPGADENLKWDLSFTGIYKRFLNNLVRYTGYVSCRIVFIKESAYRYRSGISDYFGGVR